MPRVLISHPGRQHAYQAALAAQEAHTLARFVTSYYWASGGLLPGALRSLSAGRRLEATLKRRWEPPLDATKVTALPGLYFSLRLTGRLTRAMGWQADTARWADRSFDWLVSRSLDRQPRPTIVHGFEGAALHTLRRARRLGLAGILDVPSAHEYFVKEVNEERRAYGMRAVPSDATYMGRERNQADVLLVPSAFTARCLAENGVPEDRLIELPYGADAERFSPPPPSPRSTFRVLFVGRVSLRKGIQYALEAWKKANLQDAELVIAGGIDEEARGLLQHAPAGVRFLENVPFRTVHHLYQSSEVFLLPSLAEGSAYVTYEAMAAALPVILTANCGAVARDGIDGYIVPVRDSNAIADRLRHLYRQPALRGRMGESGRCLILDRYTWRHYRQRLKAIYSGLAEGRVAGGLDKIGAGALRRA